MDGPLRARTGPSAPLTRMAAPLHVVPMGAQKTIAVDMDREHHALEPLENLGFGQLLWGGDSPPKILWRHRKRGGVPPPIEPEPTASPFVRDHP